MPPMILDQTDRVGDERRLQGVFAHAWLHCRDFRLKLCEAAGWPELSQYVQEESQQNASFRADIVVGNDGEVRVIELKVWHTLSDGQMTAARAGKLHLIIAPRMRVASVMAELPGKAATKPRVLSWQDVEAMAEGTSAHALFVGLSHWIDDGSVLRTRDIADILRRQEKGKSPPQLRRFLSAVNEAVSDAHRFETGSERREFKGPCRYIGFDVTYHPGPGTHGLWAGFFWSRGRKEVIWAVQDGEEEFGHCDLPAFATNDGQGHGLVVWRLADGRKLDVEEIATATIAALYKLMGKTPPPAQK